MEGKGGENSGAERERDGRWRVEENGAAESARFKSRLLAPKQLPSDLNENKTYIFHLVLIENNIQHTLTLSHSRKWEQ
jgi:hypothetical protein